MPIEDSRNKGGTLTLDAQPFAKQATTVELEPSVDEEGDRVETLDESTIEPDEVTSWALNVGVVQDFNDPAGFVEFCRANAGQIVPFSWLPNAAGAPTYSGTCRVRATTIGGEVASRLASSVAFPVVGEPEPAYPAP
jgi:hypothetical protein